MCDLLYYNFFLEQGQQVSPLFAMIWYRYIHFGLCIVLPDGVSQIVHCLDFDFCYIFTLFQLQALYCV